MQYKNTISGMVVTTDGPDPTYERHPRWRRVEGEPNAVAAPVTAPAGEAPSGNATTGEWQEYAISRGMPEDQARASSRNQLRKLYG